MVPQIFFFLTSLPALVYIIYWAFLTLLLTVYRSMINQQQELTCEDAIQGWKSGYK